MKENRLDKQNHLSSLTKKGIGQRFHFSGISSWWKIKNSTPTDENLINSIPILFNNDKTSDDTSDLRNMSQESRPLLQSLSALNASITALSGKINRNFSSENISRNTVSYLYNSNLSDHENTNSLAEDNSSIVQSIVNSTSKNSQDQTSNSFSGISKWFRKDNLSQYNIQYMANNGQLMMANESGHIKGNENKKRPYYFPSNANLNSSEVTEENNLLQKYWQTSILANSDNKEKLLDSDLLRRITSLGNNQENLKPTQYVTQNFGDIIIQPASVEISMQQLKGRLQDVLKQVKDSIY